MCNLSPLSLLPWQDMDMLLQEVLVVAEISLGIYLTLTFCGYSLEDVLCLPSSDGWANRSDQPLFRSVSALFLKLHHVQKLDIPFIASNFTCAMYNTLEEVLKCARHMATVEITCEPRIKKHVHRYFIDHAMVSTSPSANGNMTIDSFHQFFGVKWLREKPLFKFEDAQWLLIQKNVNDQQRKKNDEKRVLKFMTDHLPHVVVLGAANMSCTHLKEDIYEDEDPCDDVSSSSDDRGVLRVGGHLVIKLLESEDAKEINQICKLLFAKSSWLRPIATRPLSIEIYLICQGLKPEIKI